MMAIKTAGEALEFADASFKKDKEVVLMAINQKSSALEFADTSLKKDKNRKDGISI